MLAAAEHKLNGVLNCQTFLYIEIINNCYCFDVA